MAENLLQKRGRRNRKDSHSIYRRAKNYACFQPLYGRSTAILMDTAPFRVNDAAVLWSRFCGKTGSIRQRLTRSAAVVRIENRNFILTTTVLWTALSLFIAVWFLLDGAKTYCGLH